MDAITLKELVEAVHGTLLGGYDDPETLITGVEYDNRKLQPGGVFFAFVGERSDGHRFVDASLEGGAAGCVVMQAPDHFVPGKFYVQVADTVKALGDLARYYRSKFQIPVIGVTGSVGKTTTKDMIASVLAQKWNVLKTEGNFNNHIGLPYTVMHIDHTTEVAVLEMGMNHLEEIDYLVRIAQPTIATITNIGEAHIGILGSKDNIFRAKCEIFHGLQKGGLAVLNADDGYMRKLMNEEAAKILGTNPADGFTCIWQGEAEDAQYRAEKIEEGFSECMKFRAATPKGAVDLTVPALGRHMIYPVLTAAAIGEALGESMEEIVRGVASYVPTKMRMETLKLSNNILIYNDTYNANPQSMKSGLQTLAKTADHRHVAVVGDMFELGDMEEELHRSVGAFAASLGDIDTLIAVGAASAYLADEAKKCGLANVYACADKEAAKKVLDGEIKPDTAFLCKASRGMALEELANYIQENVEN